MTQPSKATTQPSLFEQPVNTTEQRVMVAAIKPNPDIDPGDVLKSVRVVGVLQPLLLKPIQDPAYLYEVVAGGRRLNSALRYELSDVPAIITTGNETEAQLAMLRALENTARSANPVAEGRAFRKVLDSGLYPSEREMASEMGIDVQLIRKRLKLVRLPDDILQAVENGKLGETTAERIVKLDTPYQRSAIQATRQALAEGERFTAKDLKEIRTRQQGDMSQALGSLLGQVPSAQMQPILTLTPAQLLAEEFRMIAQERNLPLQDVLAVLGYVPCQTAQDAGPESAALPFTPPGPQPAAPDTGSLPFGPPAPSVTLPFAPPSSPAQEAAPVAEAPAAPTPETQEVQVPALLAIETAQARGLAPDALDLFQNAEAAGDDQLEEIPWPELAGSGQKESTLSAGPRMDDLEDPEPPAPAALNLLGVPVTEVTADEAEEELPWPTGGSNPLADLTAEAQRSEAAIRAAELPEEGPHLPFGNVTPAPRLNVQASAAPAPRINVTQPGRQPGQRVSINTRR